MDVKESPQPVPTARRRRRWIARAAASVGGAALVAVMGWSLVAPTQRGWAARVSYDLLHILRGPREVSEACIVFLDEQSGARLGQRGAVWDRSVHTRLVRRLTQEGARAVFFDVVFSEASADPAVDAELAAAIAENGRVFLGAGLEPDYGASALQERVVPPTPVLRHAAAGWGLIAFRPVDADYGVRRIYTGTDLAPSATWRAADRLGAKLPADAEGRAQARWLHYYGPANSFPNVGYDRALSDDELPPDFFRDRIVFIGGRSTLGHLSLGKDDFRTPHGLVGGHFAKGVEVHLTTLLNLLRGDWLRRLAPGREVALVLAWGLMLGAALPWLRPAAAAIAGLLAGGAMAGVAVMLHTGGHLWWAWIVPAMVQPGVALGWAVGARYFIEERRRRRLLDAFSRYLSPEMAARIADADFDLTPGGKVVRATVMFTDLEDYSGLCERLGSPQHIGRVLNSYFTRTIGHILESHGTVIKYMGDSVQAVWGTPLPDAEQVRKAVRAAWRLHVASREECEGCSLRTRIGLNFDEVLAGNLGSAERFDFSVIGAAVNLASRFEGLNKYLGTDILISESIRAEIGAEFDTRPLGVFRVVGIRAPQRLHELLGLSAPEAEAEWRGAFARGLAAFQRGDFDAAEQGMREADARRPGGDGPARFYIEHIAALRMGGMPAEWDGVVESTRK